MFKLLDLIIIKFTFLPVDNTDSDVEISNTARETVSNALETSIFDLTPRICVLDFLIQSADSNNTLGR